MNLMEAVAQLQEFINQGGNPELFHISVEYNRPVVYTRAPEERATRFRNYLSQFGIEVRTQTLQ